MMHDHHAHFSAIGATLLIALFALVAIGFTLGVLSNRLRWALLAAAITGGAFQLGHFAEHVAQTGYWSTHHNDAPWMTPWASALARSFGTLAPATPGFGMEALHLVGNAIFLAGAIAILAVVVRDAPQSCRPPARLGVGVQVVHVAEHVALTASVVLTGRAIGISTLFGTLDPGPGLWTYRIWWHLSINTIATALLFVALARWRRARTPRGVGRRAPALAT